MPKLIITDIAGLNGEYDFGLASFTNRELHLIKQESGVRAGELGEAFAARDNDLLVALAMITLQRAGKGDISQFKDLLWDADAGKITFDLTDEEKAEAKQEEMLPPPSAPDAGSELNLSERDSGAASGNGSESRASAPSPIGSPAVD